MKAIIVDDEQLLLNEFRKMLGLYSGIDVVGAYADPLEALREIEETRPDTAFLDIEMRGLNGIELAERLLNKLPELDIFFVTAYNHYATEAFDANAVDYLLKPVRPERLKRALERLDKKKPAIKRQDQQERQEGQPLRIRFFGKFRVYAGDEALKYNRTKQRELLAYLLQNEGRWVDKYKICDDLWHDSYPEQALANLQTAVWAVRKVLKESGAASARIDFANNSYILSLKEAQWDLRLFDSALRAFMDNGNVERGREALELYGEGYLFCEDWPWAVFEREKYAFRQERLKKALADRKKA
jgi:two-component SAPR family response regulator